MNGNSKEDLIKKTSFSKLLDVTPVLVQDTASILNTLIFMCLDQGHDFRAGDSRTTTSDGCSTWVDPDFYVDKKICYLNKIKKQNFNDNYISSIASSSSGTVTISSDLIFGKNEFIKGLLNTTFVGGNSNYGFVVVEDSELASLGENPESKIVEIITSIIEIKLKLSNSYYYIYSDNDSKGDSGLNIKNDEYDLLFLPFYQRVYNNGMHQLWTFNTIKHIYLIKLDQLTIVNNNNNYTTESPKFSCQYLNKIDLIIPQYILNFELYYNTYLKQYSKNFKEYFEGKEEEAKTTFLSCLLEGDCLSKDKSLIKQEPLIKLTRDHILSLSNGGTDDITNIQPLCVQCNSKKSTKTIRY
jgi:hypothetical protein